MLGKIIHGDALEELKKLPDESVDCCMSSPPYWALRDYGVEGQLGSEPTFEEFITKLCGIYDEVKRVLKKTGTCWVNLGDTYASTPAGNKEIKEEGDGVYGRLMKRHTQGGTTEVTQKPKEYGHIREKSLVCIPFRFAIEMTNRGWILRNTIIWHKKNCMPQSAKDRFTVDFEYLFFFTKAKKYYFDIQRDPLTSNTPFKPFNQRIRDVKRGKIASAQYKASEKELAETDKYGIKLEKGAPGQTPHHFQRKGHSGYFDGDGKPLFNPQGRNKRCVWTINPKPFPEAHFAVYPEELCETPIKAGCPEFVCKKCGKPRERGYETSYEYEKNQRGELKPNTHKDKQMWREGGKTQFAAFAHEYRAKRVDTFKQYTTPCSCDAGYESGIVLDPFLGSGTTALVAEKLGRRWIGIELNEEYVKIAERRLEPYKNQSRLMEVLG